MKTCKSIYFIPILCLFVMALLPLSASGVQDESEETFVYENCPVLWEKLQPVMMK